VVDDAGAIAGSAQLATQGLWVELCAGACVGALAQLRARGEIAPSEHALLLLTAKGDRDTLDVFP
jgi:threonine synthase